MLLISACLLGLPCRYDGAACPSPAAMQSMQQRKVVPFCPEQMGGLPTPRLPCEIQGGDGRAVLRGQARVRDCAGNNLTVEFLRGAHATLAFCQQWGIRQAMLKSRSPSCGCGTIYDGSFGGVLRPGDGVTSALLKQQGIDIIVC